MTIQYITNVRMPTEKAHGIQIAKACEAFAKLGHNVELIVPVRRNPITETAFLYYGIRENFKIQYVPVFDTVGWGALGFLVETHSFARGARRYVNAAACVYGRDERVLAYLIKKGTKRVVWESHDGAWNQAAAYVGRYASALVVVTQDAKDFYTEKGVAPEKIFVTSNGVDLAAFAHPESKEAARKRLSLPLDQKLVLYIGRLDGWKGSDTFLEASNYLTAAKLAVIGGEPAQVSALKAKYQNVIFIGYRPYRELRDNQASADVLVVPNTAKSEISLRFTSPLKLLAHLASERPIVASDLPTLREIGGGAALYVRPDDPQALARGINEVLADPSLAARLVAQAKHQVVQYDWIARASRILLFITPRV